ncbi:MAG: aspartate aminotransferase family protein [Lysobacterales bacterium]
MNAKDYYQWAERAARWGANYLKTLRDRPVRPAVVPGATVAKIEPAAPEQPTDMEEIFADFERIVPDAMTHWQHPRFFAYFPANAAPVSMIAEQLSAVMAAQCMLWQTSPAATEMEGVMVDWMRQAVGLPVGFDGLIQDSATTSTVCALLTIRERALDWQGNKSGLFGQAPLRVYASPHNHSSIDKAVRISGIGQDNLVKVATDDNWALDPQALTDAIEEDLQAGRVPAGVVLCIGGTSLGVSDRLRETIAVAHRHKLYVHVDAAWAGSAMICPELRGVWDGIEDADSIVLNPHKWLGAQFDCTIQFLKDPEAQIKTLGIQPDYLKTLGQNDITNYSEWTIPLGRRFRALKLWFLLRAHGLEQLRERIRNHIRWAQEAEAAIKQTPNFRITSASNLSLFTFQFSPPDRTANEATEQLLVAINNDGRTYLTQTMLDDEFVIRFQVGQFDCTREDVMTAVEVIQELSQIAGDEVTER